MLIKQIFILACIIFLFSNCSTVKKYTVLGYKQEISDRVDSAFVNIGLDLEKTDSVRYYNGPMNRDFKLEFIQKTSDLTELIFYNPSFLDFYSDNLMKVVHAELENDYLISIKRKSKTKHTLLSMLSPGFGWYYMTDESIYWDSKSKWMSAAFVMFDIISLYEIFNEKEFVEGWLTMMLSMRLSITFYGNYFISYDNKLIRTGYNIRF